MQNCVTKVPCDHWVVPFIPPPPFFGRAARAGGKIFFPAFLAASSKLQNKTTTTTTTTHVIASFSDDELRTRHISLLYYFLNCRTIKSFPPVGKLLLRSQHHTDTMKSAVFFIAAVVTVTDVGAFSSFNGQQLQRGVRNAGTMTMEYIPT